MSEYQYYEFQTIDRPLTNQEQWQLQEISSRAIITPTKFSVFYNYSDLRAHPKELLANYFDVYFYIANWGCIQLMFRFPKELIDIDAITPYCYEYYLSVETINQYVILKIEFYNEEGFGWIEGEGLLAPLIPLRNDILHGDYRTLYLAWLKSLSEEREDEDAPEPPVPAGLNDLSAALTEFVELFEIDEYLIDVAAENSSKTEDESEKNYRAAIQTLSREECNDYLLRLAADEPHLSIKFNKRLDEFFATPETVENDRRTGKQLIQEAEEKARKEAERRAREAEARRIKELKELVQRKDKIWKEVDELIQKTNGKAYDEAVVLLKKLKEVADYEGKLSTFWELMEERVTTPYKNRPALKRRLRKANLMS